MNIMRLLRSQRDEHGHAAVTGALAVTSILALIVILAGLREPIHSLITTPHPYLGWSDWVVADAKQVASGGWIYGDPSRDYIGLLYTPLYTVALAALLRLSPWEGWAVVISLAAFFVTCAALAGMTGRLLRDERRAVLVVDFAVRYAFWGTVLWFCFGAIPVNGLFEARPEQFAWMWVTLATALAARSLVRFRPLSCGRLLGVGFLLVAAVFSKQTTLPFAVLLTAFVVANQYLVLPTIRRATTSVVVAAVPVLLVAGFGVVVLQEQSRGFFIDLAMGVPTRHARLSTTGEGIERIRFFAQPALILVVSIAVVAVVYGALRFRIRRTWMLLGWCVLALGAQVYASATAISKQGGDSNQAVGVVLVAMISTALMSSVVLQRIRVAFFAAVVLVVMFVPIGGAVPILQRQSVGPTNFPPIPAALVDANARGERVFDMYFYPSAGVIRGSDANPGVLFTELAPAGYAPRSMISGLLSGKFSLAAKLDAAYLDQYASAFGQRDDSIAWKINWILDSAFVPSGVIVGGVEYLKPRPDLQRFAWMNGCFSPWGTSGRRVVQVGGLGAWCLDQGALLLVKFAGPMTVFALDVNRSDVLELRGGQTLANCPVFQVQDEALRLAPIQSTVGRRFVCRYRFSELGKQERWRGQLLVPMPAIDELGFQESSLELASPHPGDPALTMVRDNVATP